MDLRFTTPDLSRLDLAVTEVLAVPLVQGERPPRGVAGLVDYRMGGTLSRLVARGFATGVAGEVVLVPGRPKLSFDKVILFGMGPTASFAEHVYRAVVERMLDTLEHLGVKRALVELPGRAQGLIAADRAADILLERAAEKPWHDTWTLIDAADAQRVVTQRMQQDRRRQWR